MGHPGGDLCGRAAAAGSDGLANWPQTLITPIEAFINRGVLMVGAYLVLTGDNDASVGVGSGWWPS